MINSLTTATLILLPNSLYCCFSFTVEGNKNVSGNDIKRKTSFGVKNLSWSDDFGCEFDSINFKFKSNSFLVILQNTEPVPSRYLEYDFVKQIEFVESKVQISRTWNRFSSISTGNKYCSVFAFESI